MASEATRTRRSAVRALIGGALCAALALGGSGVAIAEEVPPGDQQYRPLVHYTPEKNWMNDPNGMVLVDGTYHLFYQHNPDGTQWGNMSWGHATSTDLLHWQEQPLAIPQTFDDDGQAIEDIFSGSIVVDRTNSAGFGPAGSRPLVAIYTSAYTPQHPQRPGIQAQSLAYSLDDGQTWTKHDGNPVLDRGSDNFRDPKVFWYDGPAGAYWVMTAVEAVQHKVLLYKSTDLKSWTFLSDFGPANSTGGVWECPDLFELPVDGDPGNTKWVMVVNLNPGGVNGGSGGQYFVGDFDGVTFTSETTDAATTPPSGTVFAGFDDGTYEGWTVTNEPGNWADGPWGSRPATGALDGQSEVTGFLGGGLVNGFLDHDWPVGTLESPSFTIDDPYVNLLVGGGHHPYVAGTQLGNVPPAGHTLYDFEGPGTLADAGWQLTGDFATEPWRSPSSEGGDFMLGDRLINTFAGGPRGDENIGSLTSPEFTIDGDHLSFLVGGGERTDGSLQAELLVDGQVVRTQTGRNDGAMDWVSWDVAAFEGRQARFRVVDTATGGWGSLAVDHIVMGDEPAQPRSAETSVSLIVDGQVVRSATGADSEHLDWVSWNVAEFAGREARIRIVDNNRGGWGHILVDQIMFSDAPARTALEGYDWLDWGRDYYAAVSYSGTPSGSRIMQGWMNNWDYANDVPTSTWRSSMSLPREVTLVSTPDGPRLRQRVVPQIESQLDHAAAQTRTAVALDGAVDLGLTGEVVKIDAVLRPGAAAQAGITVLGDASSGTRIGYDTTTGRVFVDRRDSGDVGFNASFASVDDAPVALRPDGTITLELYVDRASVELFTDDGRLTLTDQVFPHAGADTISAWATGEGAVLESITVTPLIPTMWKVPSAPRPEMEVTTSSRCMAGKVTVTAQAHNPDEAPVTVSLTTPHGARTLTVEGGKTVSAAFTTRARSIPAGEAQVVATAQIDGQPVTSVSAAPIEARTC